MIEHSAKYDKAVVADSRRQYVRAVFDLLDPDAVFGTVSTNNANEKSKTEQVIDRGAEESLPKYATLEPNRWSLDGSWNIYPDSASELTEHIGWLSETMSDDNGNFPEPFPYVQSEFTGVKILQAVTLQFGLYEPDGIPIDFSVSIYSGDQEVENIDVTGNTSTSLVLDGFSIDYPTAIRLTIKKWSKPNRRIRISRVMAGLFETWETTEIRDVDIYTESTFSGLSIPYSTCSLTIDNSDNRFDPYAPNSIFTSIEERQSIPVEMGLRLDDGTTEWIPGGTYYQKSGGWEIQDLTVKWDLLDIIGMLVNRRFVVPDTLPTTLGGWIGAIVSSIGVNFTDLYIVDDDVSSTPLTAKKEEVEGYFCGELLRYACMATNTWPRQDMQTGKLRVGKLERLEGNKITLDNMPSYASMEANDDIADITFSLDKDEDGNTQEVTFPGTNTESDVSLRVKNPFVHTTDDARKAVVSCLLEYGGKYFEVRSRGNPSSETGDIMSISTQFGTEIAARLYKQQLKLDQGVMRNMPSYLVQSKNDGDTYTNKIILTGSGSWSSPEGYQKIKATIIQGGSGGRGGGGGVIIESGWERPDDTEGGNPGDGGKVLIVEINVSSGMQFSYSCGAAGVGGAGGQEGENGTYGTSGVETVFGQYSSASGKLYKNGVMDIKTGSVYASQGGKNATNYGCGGEGGKNGENGYMYAEMDGSVVIENVLAKKPTPGGNGYDGKPGCIIVEW